jgi:excinuclease ABC subunit A
LGHELFFDERLVVPDVTLKALPMGPLHHGARANHPISCKRSKQLPVITALIHEGANGKICPPHVQEVFLRGSGDEEIQFRYDEGGRVYQVSRVFEGVIPNMERRYRETDSAWIREEFERYQNNRPCGSLQWLPPAPEALAVKIAGCTWAKWCKCRSEAYDWSKPCQRP